MNPLSHTFANLVNRVRGRQNTDRLMPNPCFFLLTRYGDGLFTYTLPEGKLKWKIFRHKEMDQDGHGLGVTADEQGRLFVCNEDRARVHMVSAPDGVYRGVVPKNEVVGIPYRIAWQNPSTSLVVDHQMGGDRHLSVFSRRNWCIKRTDSFTLFTK